MTCDPLFTCLLQHVETLSHSRPRPIQGVQGWPRGPLLGVFSNQVSHDVREEVPFSFFIAGDLYTVHEINISMPRIMRITEGAYSILLSMTHRMRNWHAAAALSS